MFDSDVSNSLMGTYYSNHFHVLTIQSKWRKLLKVEKKVKYYGFYLTNIAEQRARLKEETLEITHSK